MTQNLRILIADDEPQTRMTVADALSDAGFDVVEADSGDVALQILDSEAERVDAVMTGLSMPGRVDAIELACRAHEKWPWLRLIIRSGNPAEAPASLPAGAQLLPKPSSIRSMPRQVRDIVLRAA